MPQVLVVASVAARSPWKQLQCAPPRQSWCAVPRIDGQLPSVASSQCWAECLATVLCPQPALRVSSGTEGWDGEKEGFWMLLAAFGAHRISSHPSFRAQTWLSAAVRAPPQMGFEPRLRRNDRSGSIGMAGLFMCSRRAQVLPGPQRAGVRPLPDRQDARLAGL